MCVGGLSNLKQLSSWNFGQESVHYFIFSSLAPEKGGVVFLTGGRISPTVAS